MDRQPSFGQWLRQQRKQRDLSQSDLAERAHCSADTIQKIEAGTRRPSREVATWLAEALAVPLEERAAFVQFARGQAGPPNSNKALTPREPATAPQGLALNLPAQLTMLIGREEDVARIVDLLERPDVRLVTLVGSAGIGKTRLGIEVAGRLATDFARNVCFVALAAVEDPDLVLPRIAQALGLKETAGQPLIASLTQWLRSNSMLLLIDNYEQVLDATPALLDLLAACARLKVMITSREALHVPGDWQYPVPLLATPGVDLQSPSLDAVDVAGYAAVRLFVERAAAVRPGFAIDEENAAVVAAICDRLEGLPLAIELAAARVRLLSLDEILHNIDSMLPLLSDGSRFLPARQRTLRGAIDWSYRLLSAEERRLFTRLGVFAAGCTVDGAAAVEHTERDIPAPDVLSTLASLVDKSLVRQTTSVDGEARFGMLEVIRQYATERLHESGELSSVRRAHAEYYLGLAEAAMPELLQGDQARWLRRLEDEHQNVRVALGWLLEGEAAHVELALRICCSMALFWDIRGHFSEGRRWLRLGLDRAERWSAAADSEEGYGPITAAVRARAYKAAGNLANKQGDTELALQFQQMSLNLYMSIGDRRGVASTCLNLGNAMSSLADFVAARDWHQQALDLFRELDDRPHIAICLDNLGNTMRGLGDRARARELQEESLVLRRELGDTYGESIALNNLGYGALLAGDLPRARRMLEDGLALARGLNYSYGIAYLLNTLGQVAVEEGAYHEAQRLLDEAHAISRQIGDDYGLVYSFECTAGLARARGDVTRARATYRNMLELCRTLKDRGGIIRGMEGLALLCATSGEIREAAVLLGAAAALREQTGAAPATKDTRAGEQAQAFVEKQLGAGAVVTALAEGRAMSMEQAVAYAFQCIGDMR